MPGVSKAIGRVTGDCIIPVVGTGAGSIGVANRGNITGWAGILGAGPECDVDDRVTQAA